MNTERWNEAEAKIRGYVTLAGEEARISRYDVAGTDSLREERGLYFLIKAAALSLDMTFRSRMPLVTVTNKSTMAFSFSLPKGADPIKDGLLEGLAEPYKTRVYTRLIQNMMAEMAKKEWIDTISKEFSIKLLTRKPEGFRDPRPMYRYRIAKTGALKIVAAAGKDPFADNESVTIGEGKGGLYYEWFSTQGIASEMLAEILGFAAMDGLAVRLYNAENPDAPLPGAVDPMQEYLESLSKKQGKLLVVHGGYGPRFTLETLTVVDEFGAKLYEGSYEGASPRDAYLAAARDTQSLFSSAGTITGYDLGRLYRCFRFAGVPVDEDEEKFIDLLAVSGRIRSSPMRLSDCADFYGYSGKGEGALAEAKKTAFCAQRLDDEYRRLLHADVPRHKITGISGYLGARPFPK